MDCNEARTLLLARRSGTLAERSGQEREVDSHLAECAACRHEDAADRELSAALERLPRRRAPESLVRSLEARFATAPVLVPAAALEPRARRAARTATSMIAGAAIALAAAYALKVGSSTDPMVTEAVNDYVRIVASEHPLDVPSGGAHQVKPWFEGRLDFAPVVPFAGDDDFPLEGGSIAYFIDRKAAAYVYKRRLHVITLFVFRADGLAWPTLHLEPLGSAGRARALVQTSKGFHVITWRNGDLGYALVSDVDERELRSLGAKIAGE